MFCYKCGQTISDGAKFCRHCGTSQPSNQAPVNTAPAAPAAPAVSSEPLKEGKVLKCPACGEILPFDAITCPACGSEIRDKKSSESVNDLVNKIQAEPNEERKIELIKLYPVPNTREDIFEFMFVATSKFDAGFYASNPTEHSIAGAWYTQINQCYQKGLVLFNDAGDRARLEQLYNSVFGPEGSLTKEKQKRKQFTIIAVSALCVGALLFVMSYVFGQENSMNTGLFLGSTVFIAAGIFIFIKFLSKKKTAKDLEIDQQKREMKAQAKREAIERKDRLQREAAERAARK